MTNLEAARLSGSLDPGRTTLEETRLTKPIVSRELWQTIGGIMIFMESRMVLSNGTRST